VARVGVHGSGKGKSISNERVLNTKWASLKKRGYTPPANEEERKQRLRECSYDRVSG